MPPKPKRPSISDRVREALQRLLDELGPLLKPGRLAPRPVPARPATPPRRPRA